MLRVGHIKYGLDRDHAGQRILTNTMMLSEIFLWTLQKSDVNIPLNHLYDYVPGVVPATIDRFIFRSHFLAYSSQIAY